MFRAPSVFLLLAALGSEGCSLHGGRKSQEDDLLVACQVTDLALASNTSDDRPWSLSGAGPRQGDTWHTEEFVLQIPQAGDDPGGPPGWRSGFVVGEVPIRTAGPSVEMARAFALSAAVNGDTCPEVRARAEGANRRFPSKASDTASADPEAAFSKAEVMLDRAVVAPNGREAIVYFGTQSAPLAGGGFLILYRREGQDWKEAARLPVWVS